MVVADAGAVLVDSLLQVSKFKYGVLELHEELDGPRENASARVGRRGSEIYERLYSIVPRCCRRGMVTRARDRA